MARKKQKRTSRHYLKQNIILSLVAFVPFAMLVLMIIPAQRFQIGGELIDRVKTDEKIIALTFDDGPQPGHTQALIDTLKKNEVPATFFLIGVEIERYPEEVRRLVREGFAIGNHSYRHDSLVFKTQKYIAADIEKTDELIREAGYEGTIYFRPPYGHKLFGLPYYLATHNRPTVMWDIEADDNSHLQSPQSVVRKVIDNIRPGSIVVLHGMHDHNAPVREAITQIAVEARSLGYRFVTIDRLLTYR